MIFHLGMFFVREIERWCVKQDDGRFPSARCLFTTRFPQRLLGLFVAGLTALAVHAGPTDVPSTLVGFNIPAGAAEHGLRLFARQAGVEVLFEVEQVKGRQANAVEGRFTPRSALEALVAGTGLVILQDEETGAMAVKTGHPTVDPDKALPVLDMKIKPCLIDQATGVKMMVPDPPKVGQLRAHTMKPLAGKIYYIIFANPGNYIKRGRRVTVVVGDFKAENIIVE